MKILLAEDDAALADYIRAGLEEEGHSVEHFADGRDALAFSLYETCDLAILDRMMPGMNGMALLRALRAAGRDLPVIFVTAMGEVDDRVEGLTAGADDYIAKPFHFEELLARIGTVTRRKGGKPAETRLVVHDLELDLLSRTARRKGQVIALQNKEFALLEVLMRNSGRVMTRTLLLERVWNYSFEPNTTVLETHMSRLRAKIDKPFDVPLIHRIRNAGYSLHGPR
ncbi:response regulator transcription factor [Tropicimonas sp. IMCC6043]|uniref:response regulator transcription factor n=1 Tax=Tropicimonas sp. IMCC6043 TaxID=2510645 RepID=UPI00101E17B8|nr:response regulator transcription factor [Tropicimonas sp. IMCC6043]RYH09409.1 response regulator transcription factor [Tropicimonas sp. IMCC6043]